jgi:hypothetical protein
VNVKGRSEFGAAFHHTRASELFGGGGLRRFGFRFRRQSIFSSSCVSRTLLRLACGAARRVQI